MIGVGAVVVRVISNLSMTMKVTMMQSRWTETMQMKTQ